MHARSVRTLYAHSAFQPTLSFFLLSCFVWKSMTAASSRWERCRIDHAGGFFFFFSRFISHFPRARQKQRTGKTYTFGRGIFCLAGQLYDFTTWAPWMLRTWISKSCEWLQDALWLKQYHNFRQTLYQYVWIYIYRNSLPLKSENIQIRTKAEATRRPGASIKLSERLSS